MSIEEREKATKIRNRISAIGRGTRYRVEQGILHVQVPGGLQQEQRALIQPNRDALVALFTSPPDVQGQCRGGHPVEWKLDTYGVWVCACHMAGKQAAQDCLPGL